MIAARNVRRRSTVKQRILRAFEVVGLAVMLLAFWVAALSLPGSAPTPRTALVNRQRLDRELQRAQADLGVPASLLAPIIAQEQVVRNADRGVSENDQVAASDYALLLTQARQVEQTANVTLHDTANGEVELLMTALTTARAQNFPYVFDYQARLEQAQRQLASAHTIRDNASVEALLSGQLIALRTMGPAWTTFQSLHTQLETLRLAGVPSALGEAAWASDEAAFRDGATPQRYAALIPAMHAQMQQVTTDLTQSLLAKGGATLAHIQPSIDALRRSGDATNAATFQRQRAAAQALAMAGDPAAHLAQAQTFAAQIMGMGLPLLRLQAQQDTQALGALVTRAQRERLRDPFTGAYYPAAYEYADPIVGYPHILAEMRAAKTVDAVQRADNDATVMSESLSALLADLKDKTPAAQPHATDLRLLQQMGVTHGKVIVVSLVEQVIRFYDDGKLANWSYITTGRPELPSPPGVHFAVSKASPVLFVSPEARTSPLWFEPTPVHYAILYANGDDFIHDAWWRTQFGPGTQLPHYDPIAFNGGSHGCINLPLKAMTWVYDWTPVGAPVVVY
jgi:hypothetical protein